MVDSRPVGIILLKRMMGRGGVSPASGQPFHADSNELLFVSIGSVDAHRDLGGL